MVPGARTPVGAGDFITIPPSCHHCTLLFQKCTYGKEPHWEDHLSTIVPYFTIL